MLDTVLNFVYIFNYMFFSIPLYIGYENNLS